MDRRSFVIGSALSAGSISLLPSLCSSELSSFELNKPSMKERAKGADELIDADTQKAIDVGLAYLRRRQVRNGVHQGAFGTVGYAGGVAVTALAGMSFLCSGSTPFDGKYSSNIKQCTKYILSRVNTDGYIAQRNEAQFSNMYGHGYALLYLTQVYGMSPSNEIEEKLKLAVDMTCKVQNARGGWRYQPNNRQAGDLSITVCQVMALRAANNAGFFVPSEVLEKTEKYIEDSQTQQGSFKYMLRGGRTTVALTAAGVVSYYSAGIYEGEKIDKALKWIYDRRPGKGSSQQVSPMNYYYAHYYAIQAMWHAQIQHPNYWNNWYPAIRDELIQKKRAKNGTWPDSRVGPEFGTAMATIVLQIPFNYLPIFAP